MIKDWQAFIALRYLKVRSRELFISLISWISVGGVALGVGALIVVMSVMAGFEREIRDKILGANSHVRILPAEGGELTDWGTVAGKARAVPGVLAASPYVDGRVMLMTDLRVQGVELRGFDPADAEGVGLGRYLVGAGPDDLTKGERPGIFVGKEMAQNWGLRIGDLVKVVSPSASATPAGPAPRFRMYRVAGYFVTGMYEYDTGRVYMALDEARDFLRLDRGVSGVEVKLSDIYGAGEAARALKSTLGDGYAVRDWTEMNRSLFGALKLEKFAMYLILGLIVVVAAFNIASTLTMVVMDKARAIGILKSMGVSREGVRNIFLIEGSVIGVLGASIGCALGVLAAWSLKKFEFIRLPQDVYYTTTLPVVLDGFFVVAVSLAALALCLCAAWYPAWKAARLDPVETLRY